MSGPCVGLHPQRDDFALPIATCWYLKMRKPEAKSKICVTQRKSQLNIGCVGYQTQNFRVGHVHLMFFVLISFAFGSQRKPSFQWNMGLSLPYIQSDTPTNTSFLCNEQLCQCICKFKYFCVPVGTLHASQWSAFKHHDMPKSENARPPGICRSKKVNNNLHAV